MKVQEGGNTTAQLVAALPIDLLVGSIKPLQSVLRVCPCVPLPLTLSLLAASLEQTPAKVLPRPTGPSGTQIGVARPSGQAKMQ